MTTTTFQDTPGAPAVPRVLAPDAWRHLWLGLGILASLFSVGGRWDIALAAWIAPVFLLRFSRATSPWIGQGLILLVSIAGPVWWSLQLAIALQLSTVLFCIALGMAYTLPYVIDRLISARLGLVARLMVFPAAVVLCEYVVGTFSPLGTAYGLKAITQSGNLPLLQLASITGSYGIGFLIGWFATAANQVWANPTWQAARWPAGAFIIALLAVLIGGGARLAFGEAGANRPTVKIAGITPSMTTQKQAASLFGSNGLPATKEAYQSADPAVLQAAYAVVQNELLARTQEVARAGAKIVVWSETAATSSQAATPALLRRAAEVARQEGIYINVAIGEPFARNETHMIDPNGRELYMYRKTHPVPGMEPVPPSNMPVPRVDTPFGRIANVICFDADFPALTRVDASIMLVPGWDWPEIGRTHTLKMASLRAIENGYALFRQDYNGHSAAFDRFGHVLASQSTVPAESHTMFADVPMNGQRTLYNRIGDIFSWLCGAGVIVAIGLAFTRRSALDGHQA